MNDQNFPSNNIGYLCTDWQVKQGRGEKAALIWVTSDLESKVYSFRELLEKSNQVANMLKGLGLQAGDKMMILLPRSPELFFFFLGALKANVNTCILFTSIGDETLRDRILDSGTQYIVTNPSLIYKINSITKDLPVDFNVILLGDNTRSKNLIGIDTLLTNSEISFEVPWTSKEQASHFHFTSGSTGKPKGVQHIHGSAKAISASFLEVMQPEPDDLYWCTADQGWVTGTSYGIIGPWINGITQLQLQGTFRADLWMQVLEKFRVNILYSAPTVFRMLMQTEDDFYFQFDFSALKRIYCVGEPLNPIIFDWGRRVFGKDIFDTWFQTETGSIIISNRPGLEIRPGSMGKPLSYLTAAILDEKGKPVQPREKGLLCIKTPWASMFSEYINNPETYQEKFLDDYYSSGDIAFADADGYFWFIGRNDDVINTAGHLVSPFEVESALLEVDKVADVGVVGVPDDLLFEKVVAFIVWKGTLSNQKQAEVKLKIYVANKVSSIAAPKEIYFVQSIPKTKSGKIMRRVLQRKYLNQDLGDLSTLEE